MGRHPPNRPPRVKNESEEDINTSAAELVYGTTLRIPGELVVDADSIDPQQIYVERLRRHMREIRPVPTAHHCKRRPFTHKDLYTCTHVLLKLIGGKRSLDQPFERPYKVLERISDTVFKIKVNDVPLTVSTERLKPAFIEGLPQQIANDLTNPADPVTQSLDTHTQPTSVSLFIAQPTSPTSSTTPIPQPSMRDAGKSTELPSESQN